MLAGCFLITHLPIKAELVRRPELAGRAVALLDGPESRPVVLAPPEKRRGCSQVNRSRWRCPVAEIC